jgi:hypothetical protein
VNDSTVKDLENLFTKGRSTRRKLEPVWAMNLAYYSGSQWMAHDGVGLYQPKLANHRVTHVDNRIQPCVRLEVAKMTKNRPVFTVSPRTADEEDENASEMAEQLMRYLWKHLDMQEKMTKALLWSRICGAGFVKTFWDPSLGDGMDVVVGPDGKPLSDASGRPIRPNQVNPAELSQRLGVDVQSRRINQGDICIEVRSPFQMVVDPIADSFNDAEWLAEESIQSVESLQRRYHVTLQPDAAANPGLLQSLMSAELSAGTGSYRGVKIREYWSKPNSQHPNGRRAVWSKDQLLFEDNNPFDAFPYVMLSGIPVPGRLWPTCIVEQLRGPQTELNKIKSQIIENRNRVGNPTIMANINAIIGDKDAFVASITKPGGIAWWQDVGSPNRPFDYLQAPPLPEYVVQSVQMAEESIQEISGQHEVSSASVPPGVTAASAINLLLEADDTRLGPSVTDYEVNLAALGQKILKQAAHYYTDARTIRIAGDNGVWQIFDFRGAMLRDNTHVEVQAGSAFPQSKAAKQAWIQDLLTFFVQSGNAPHGKQLAQFLQDAEVGGAERMIEEYTLDEQQAQRENLRMYQGIPVPINDYDNDESHVETHQDEQKSQRYQQASPQAKQIIEAHVAAHKQRITQNAQAQMQMQAQATGQTPPGQQAAQAGMDMQGQAAQQAQGAQGAALQQAIQQAQAQQQVAGTGVQQQQAASAADQQRQHAEELHQQKLHHLEQQHQANLQRASQPQPSQQSQRGQR